SVAGLGDVAHSGGRTAGGAGRRRKIRRTAVADPVAALGPIAVAGRGTAHGRTLGVERARRRRAGAALRHVAGTCRRPADGAGVAGGVRAGAGGVADVDGADVVVVGAGASAGLDVARGRAAIPRHVIAVVALLGGLDDAIAAGGGRRGRAGRGADDDGRRRGRSGRTAHAAGNGRVELNPRGWRHRR